MLAAWRLTSCSSQQTFHRGDLNVDEMASSIDIWIVCLSRAEIAIVAPNSMRCLTGRRDERGMAPRVRPQVHQKAEVPSQIIEAKTM